MNTKNNMYVPFQDYPDVLTNKNVQKAIRVGRNTAYRLVKNGDIKAFKIGREFHIPKQCLIDYVYGQCYNETVVGRLARQSKEVNN